MLSKELEFTLNLAFKEAREKQHEFMTVEHLLYALLGNPSAVEVLRACGAPGGASSRPCCPPRHRAAQFCGAGAAPVSQGTGASPPRHRRATAAPLPPRLVARAGVVARPEMGG